MPGLHCEGWQSRHLPRPGRFLCVYVDCRANKGDWWWGIEKYKGPDISPPEKRVIDTVKWVIDTYGIDPNRVYLCGNSMGGSGTLGIGLRHGELFRGDQGERAGPR